MKDSVNMSRRQLLGASVAAGGLAASGALLSVQALAADKVADAVATDPNDLLSNLR